MLSFGAGALMDRTGAISFPTCHGVEVSVALVSLTDVEVALRGYVVLKGRPGGIAELSRYKPTLIPTNDRRHEAGVG